MLVRVALPALAAVLFTPASWGSEVADGRYGRTEVRYLNGKPAVFHQARQVLILDEADSASIVRVVPEVRQDYIVIKSWKPVSRCQNSYRLLGIRATGPVQASGELGSCMELAGITFAGDAPIAHFRPATATGNVTQILWKDGRQNELPPMTQACFKLLENAIARSGRTLGAQVVAGEGRLQFYSAADEECAMPGVFLVPGDRLVAARSFGRYSYVQYQNPKTAKVVAGWVDSARLKPAS